MTDLPQGRFGAILADPPWHFEVWSINPGARIPHPSQHYATMGLDEIAALPVADLAADDCVLFIWITWPMLTHALAVVDSWGFKYKTCAFAWIKADVSTINLFPGPVDADMRLGYWTRANSEVCLLATRGQPKRRDAGVRQGIIEPSRQHSRKPDCVHERIERLVGGPYLELFARQRRPGWIAWGNEVDKFRPTPSEWESMWAKPFDRPELVFGNDGLAEP
jgi:N6-adenosine-specific RNA methylase IME4